MHLLQRSWDFIRREFSSDDGNEFGRYESFVSWVGRNNFVGGPYDTVLVWRQRTDDGQVQE
jgi:hypothetical protein